MPRIELMEPFGMVFRCDTRQTETILRAWFDEYLPGMHHEDPKSGEIFWPKIHVNPLFTIGNNDPDWLCDTFVIGHSYEFKAVDGDSGLRALLELRRGLERILSEERRRRKWLR